VIVFDPFPGPERRAFTVYRRGDAGLHEVESTDGDRVWSERLRCYLRRVGDDAALRLRLGLGPKGDELFPTAEEAALAAAEAERTAKEAERTAKEAALRRIAELEADLARRR
jgi:hypothetical protein